MTKTTRSTPRRTGSALSATIGAGALILAGLIPAQAAAAASAPGQTATVDYAASDEAIVNPERGFVDTTTDTHYRDTGSEFVPLDLATLRANRTDGVTAMVRVIYMEKFVDQPVLDAEWIALLQADFDTAREAGISLIPRFAYKEGTFPPPIPYGDAPVEIVLGHIAQLGPLLSRNSDVITTMQAGFIGLWGEWYYTDYFVDDPENPGVVTDADWANRRAVVDALLEALPDDRMLQVRTMQMKQEIEGVSTGAAGALTPEQAYDGSDLARIGHHNDCFLASPDDFGTFLSDPITLDQEYLAADTRFVPMGGETCNVNAPRSEYPSARADMSRYHWSYLNRDYNQAVLNSWGAAGLEETTRLLGYRFVMEQSRASGSTIEVDVRNDGWAAPYNPRPAELVLTGANGTFRVPFGSDARTWAPGTTTTITADVTDVLDGTYRASLALASPRATLADNPDFAIQMANAGTWLAAEGTNDLGLTFAVAGDVVSPVADGSTGAGAAGVGAGTAGRLQLAATGLIDAPHTAIGALLLIAGMSVLVVRRQATRRA